MPSIATATADIDAVRTSAELCSASGCMAMSATSVGDSSVAANISSAATDSSSDTSAAAVGLFSGRRASSRFNKRTSGGDAGGTEGNE